MARTAAPTAPMAAPPTAAIPPAMAAPVAALLGGADRLHLQHGPIDLIVMADGRAPADRHRAFAAAHRRFATLLDELVGELPLLRSAWHPAATRPDGSTARRMSAAAAPFCAATFITPMAAVAGAVADEILAAMRAGADLRRASVNNGGDIALWLAPGEVYVTAMRGLDGADLGRITLRHEDRIGGIATSGQGGRSLSLGIADSVTVLGRNAAGADAAATLIANAVDLPEHPGIRRWAADLLSPDSDLGPRRVVTSVPALSPFERQSALAAGADRARDYLGRGLIRAAALDLQGRQITLGAALQDTPHTRTLHHVTA